MFGKYPIWQFLKKKRKIMRHRFHSLELSCVINGLLINVTYQGLSIIIKIYILFFPFIHSYDKRKHPWVILQLFCSNADNHLISCWEEKRHFQKERKMWAWHFYAITIYVWVPSRLFHCFVTQRGLICCFYRNRVHLSVVCSFVRTTDDYAWGQSLLMKNLTYVIW